MIAIKRQLKKIYKEWRNDSYIYEKNRKGEYQPITYKDFIEKTLAIANTLIKANYKNKTIILLSENSINLMIFDLAITLFVGKSTIVCREWQKEDLIEGIKEVKADVIIYSSKYKQKVKEVKEEIQIDALPMEKIKGEYKEELWNLKVKNPNTISKIVFSSGTTGKSKGVKLTIKNIYSGLDSLQKRCHITHEDVAYLFLPMHHTYASICHFMYSIYTGHRIYISSSVSNIGKELLEVNPTFFCCVPLVLKKLVDAYKKNIDKAFGNRIRCIICGGAPLSKEIRMLFKEKGLCLMQTYAMTETSSAFTLAYPNQDDYESAGEIYEDIDVKIINKDQEGIGEIIVKGENILKGYTDNSLNKKVFDSDGYFHTGDLGYIKNKKLYIKGRKKKMLLTSNGENVSAEKIENKIRNSNPNINEVKAYVKNDKIGVSIYITKNIKIDKIIEEYNQEATIYERIKFYKVYKDSIDTRMK